MHNTGPNPSPIAEPTAADAPTPATTLRRRFGRCRRFFRRHPMVVGFGLLIMATFALRIGWGWAIDRQLAAQHRTIAGRGDPVVPADLVIADVPSDDDALPLLQKAAAADTGAAPSCSNNTYPSYPPFGAAWEQSAEASETANATVLALAREARGRSRVQFRTAWPTPLFNVNFFAPFTNIRQVCNTVGDGALYSHLRGNDQEAVDRLLDLLHIADLTQQDHTLIGQLVSMGISSLTCSRIIVISPGLRAEVPGVRRRIAELIERLLDESQQGHFVKSWSFERVFNADLQQWLSNDAWMLRPLMRQGVARDNESYAIIHQAALASDFVAARRLLTALPPSAEQKPNRALAKLMGTPIPSKELPRHSRWYSLELDISGSMERTFKHRFRTLATRRIAAISLAIQLYRADHDRRWPAKLADLVPRYLPAIPIDPFHDDGRPIGYVVLTGGLPDGGDRPLLYFDAGEVVDGAIDAEPMFDWQGEGDVTLRQYRDVARWSPATRRVDKIIAEELEAQRQAEEEERKEQEELEKQMREEGLLP